MYIIKYISSSQTARMNSTCQQDQRRGDVWVGIIMCWWIITLISPIHDPPNSETRIHLNINTKPYWRYIWYFRMNVGFHNVSTHNYKGDLLKSRPYLIYFLYNPGDKYTVFQLSMSNKLNKWYCHSLEMSECSISFHRCICDTLM